MKINLHIPKEVYERLKAEKASTGVPVAEIVRRAIVRFLGADRDDPSQSIEALEEALSNLEFLGHGTSEEAQKIRVAITKAEAARKN